jgi:hypothetical protein
MHERKDHGGNRVLAGARVRFIFAPPELLSGLPESDQAAIAAAVGKEFVVEDFDAYGHAELMFKDAGGITHFIWVRPSALEVIQ